MNCRDAINRVSTGENQLGLTGIQKETAPGDGGGISEIFRREVVGFCDFFVVLQKNTKK